MVVTGTNGQPRDPPVKFFVAQAPLKERGATSIYTIVATSVLSKPRQISHLYEDVLVRVKSTMENVKFDQQSWVIIQKCNIRLRSFIFTIK